MCSEIDPLWIAYLNIYISTIVFIVFIWTGSENVTILLHFHPCNWGLKQSIKSGITRCGLDKFFLTEIDGEIVV